MLREVRERSQGHTQLVNEKRETESELVSAGLGTSSLPLRTAGPKTQEMSAESSGTGQWNRSQKLSALTDSPASVLSTLATVKPGPT